MMIMMTTMRLLFEIFGTIALATWYVEAYHTFINWDEFSKVFRWAIIVFCPVVFIGGFIILAWDYVRSKGK